VVDADVAGAGAAGVVVGGERHVHGDVAGWDHEQPGDRCGDAGGRDGGRAVVADDRGGGPGDDVPGADLERLDVSLVGGLAAGETMRVVTDPRGRDVTFNGARDWSRVAPGDRWEPMLPGRSTVTLTMADATEASSARLFGESLFKRAW
jgi:hypothetical protein